jgi:hypothetical protein
MKTANEGAAEERSKIMRKILALQRQRGFSPFMVLETLKVWIEGRARRCAEREGGLGRKPRI